MTSKHCWLRRRLVTFWEFTTLLIATPAQAKAVSTLTMPISQTQRFGRALHRRTTRQSMWVTSTSKQARRCWLKPAMVSTAGTRTSAKTRHSVLRQRTLPMPDAGNWLTSRTRQPTRSTRPCVPIWKRDNWSLIRKPFRASRCRLSTM